MKNNLLLAVAFVSFFTLKTLGQKLSPHYLKQDMALFENLLKIHPQLNEYTTEEDLNALILETKKEIENPLTPLEFYKKLSVIVANIQDANTRLYAGKNIYTDNSFYPILFKPVGESLFADIEDQHVPVGSQLVSINGVSAENIISSIKKYIASDGFNETRKLRKIEAFFSLYYYYEYGSSKTYTSTYLTPEGNEINVTLEGCDFDVLTNLNSIRHSYTYKTKDKTTLPYLSYTDNPEVIQLTVNSFGIEPVQFKKELAHLFKIMGNEGFKHLIVDIRNNEGGYRDNAIELLTYLTKNNFSQIKSRSIKTANYPMQQHIISTFSDEDFNAIYANGLVSRKDSKAHLMKPKDNAFTGNIYVLISGLNIGNASLFAMNAKNEDNIFLVGEETGGNYYFHMGGKTVYYQLPHSKIKMVIPTERLVHDIAFGNNPEAQGVTPHYAVDINLNDLIDGKDSQFNYILESLISDKNKLQLVTKPSLPHEGVQVTR